MRTHTARAGLFGAKLLSDLLLRDRITIHHGGSTYSDNLLPRIKRWNIMQGILYYHYLSLLTLSLIDK